jgi:hypothetical protein
MRERRSADAQSVGPQAEKEEETMPVLLTVLVLALLWIALGSWSEAR